MKKMLLFSAVLISNFATAQDQCGFPASLARSGFEAGEQPASVVLPIENTPLSITVQGPTAMRKRIAMVLGVRLLATPIHMQVQSNSSPLRNQSRVATNCRGIDG
jgi:hypothetical protein